MNSPAITLTFRLVLHSDYHVGSGHRAGPLVDSALLRDHDHAPVLRGTALAGLLRDGLCALIELPALEHRVFTDAETRLFGTPERRKRWAFSSARPVGSVEGKSQRWGAQDVARVRINPRTRRSDPQKLFSEEEGDARVVFEFTATRDHANAQDIRDATLLIAAARMVRHLGSARRRGRGECSITLARADGLDLSGDQELTHRALDEFQKQWLDAAPIVERTERDVAAPSATLNTRGARKRFRIIARLDEPVIVARRSEAANAYESLATIPGSTLLGAMAERAASALQLEPGSPPPADFVTLFFRDGVRVSGLHPAVRAGATIYPTIPAPQALFTCENFPGWRDATYTIQHRVESFANNTNLPGKCREDKCMAKMEPLADFLTLQTSPRQIKPVRREEAHIEITRTGRAKTGILYEYIALEAGQWFVGELDCANDACWNQYCEWTDWSENATFTLRLGKAARRGYGLTTFVLQPLDSVEPSPWILRGLAERVTKLEPLTLTLLTDAIVSDAWGRFYAGFDKAWIAETLGVQTSEIELLGNFARTRSVDTFNTYRRNARWRDEAITAGSAAGFTITEAGLQSLELEWRKEEKLDATVPYSALAVLHWKLGEIERAGIGLRRAEGFGRVAFNHPIYASPNDLTGIALNLPDGFERVAGSHELEAEVSFRRAWMDTLDRANDWDCITERFEPVARWLFLQKRDSLEQIKLGIAQFSAPAPKFLWGKTIAAREQTAKIEAKGLALVSKFIDELAQMRELTDSQRRAGIELLAERVAIQAAKKRAG